MNFKKPILLFAFIFSVATMFGQLIVNDEFTSKGALPEGGFALEEGDIIANLRFKNLKNEFFNLHDKLEKLTIIEFWYIGCKSCVDNKKYFKKFSSQYNINLISISVDEKASSVRKYLADNEIHWDNVHDNTAFKGYYQKTLGVPTPTYLIVNTDKEIVKVFKKGSDIGRIGVFIQNYFK